jgi:hypothetical protein
VTGAIILASALVLVAVLLIVGWFVHRHDPPGI